jgi:hypothetical protein
MPNPDEVIIEVVGEGKTDIGPTIPEPKVELPAVGIVPILIHRICKMPASMRVKRRKLAFLQQGKTLEQKVKFSKRQAKYNGSAGFVFVIDSEGDHPKQLDQITRGRDAEHPDFPAAIGVAHPCIEAWLLSDARAIARALELNPLPQDPPEHPETLPAPCRDRANNPKLALGRCAGKATLSTSETTKIAGQMRDLDLIRARCPLGFAPFALEVEHRIAPIFAG